MRGYPSPHFATGPKAGISAAAFADETRMSVYGDLATGGLLGAEMLAPAAEHLAHLLAWALQNKMTLAQLLEMPFYA
jgi:dihydrolipoamide dehydrogenase